MNLADIELLEQLAIREARESFWAYRRLLNPKMKRGWWQKEIAGHLQQFYEDLLAGKRPKLAIEAPPQHGKSRQIVEFISWMAGKHPEKRTIYASFSERLGVRANLMLQRIYDSDRFKSVFPDTRINAKGTPTDDAGGATRNRELLEYIGEDGCFRNTTVRGSVTGESLDLGVIDDPVKGREEARSKAVRDKTWEWFTDDFFTRFSDAAGLLFIMTRWHVDDTLGRLRAQLGDEVKVVSYPAIAIKDEPHRKEGEPLFPEHKSLDFLLERKAAMATPNWMALYQQNPIVEGGELIRGEWFPRYKMLPMLVHRTIYVDTAQKTAERNDYTVFECWGKGTDGKIYLVDVLRGKWEAPKLRQKAKDFWNKHKAESAPELGALRVMKIEDKASGTGLIQDLKAESGIPVSGIPREKDKYTRALDAIPYCASGYVVLPEQAPWLLDYVAELECITADDTHAHDDQWDPTMDAIEEMLAGKSVSVWERLGAAPGG